MLFVEVHRARDVARQFQNVGSCHVKSVKAELNLKTSF